MSRSSNNDDHEIFLEKSRLDLEQEYGGSENGRQFKKDEQYRLYKVFKERELKSGTSNTATTKISGGGQLRSSSPLADESVDENSSQAPSAGASASGTRPNPEAEGVAKSLSSMLDSMCPLDKKGKNKENDSDTEDEDDEAQGKKPKKRKGKGRSTQQPRERTEDPQVQLYASQPFTLSATCLHYSHIIFVSSLSLSLSLPPSLSLSSLSLSLAPSLPPSRVFLNVLVSEAEAKKKELQSLNKIINGPVPKLHWLGFCLSWVPGQVMHFFTS
ncbi:unnamed protein product [Cladocopium goreaui]|uniref:Uncharacterized protein n=1 Tax=Cladocopium goreaui TaxID=2562237 RepID=A0A9P1C7I2_9DINO|nr:unnamed protein product [Cladocopium goreaui]